MRAKRLSCLNQMATLPFAQLGVLQNPKWRDGRRSVYDLIHTCRLNDINPFDYLTQLQHHAKELARNPQNWMPWNYQATLQGVRDSQAAAA